MVWHGNCQVSPASVQFYDRDDGMVCKWEPTMYVLLVLCHKVSNFHYVEGKVTLFNNHKVGLQNWKIKYETKKMLTRISAILPNALTFLLISSDIFQLPFSVPFSEFRL